MALAGIACMLAAEPLVAQRCGHTWTDSISVRQVAEGIVAADNARALDRVLAFYAPDAILHPPDEPPVHGRNAIRPRYEDLFAGYDPAIRTEIGSIDVCGDLAVVAGRNGGALLGRGGTDDRALADTFVMVLERTGDSWAISRLIWHPDGGR